MHAHVLKNSMQMVDLIDLSYSTSQRKMAMHGQVAGVKWSPRLVASHDARYMTRSTHQRTIEVLPYGGICTDHRLTNFSNDGRNLPDSAAADSGTAGFWPRICLCLCIYVRLCIVETPHHPSCLVGDCLCGRLGGGASSGRRSLSSSPCPSFVTRGSVVLFTLWPSRMQIDLLGARFLSRHLRTRRSLAPLTMFNDRLMAV